MFDSQKQRRLPLIVVILVSFVIMFSLWWRINKNTTQGNKETDNDTGSSTVTPSTVGLIDMNTTEGNKGADGGTGRSTVTPSTVGLLGGANGETKRIDDPARETNVSAVRGYLICTDYEQQQMGSFIAFKNLARFASLFNLSIVEPYIHDGRGRMGVPGVGSKKPQFLKLTDFYDHYQLKCALRSCVNADLVSFESFVENASSNVILVSFLPSIDGYKQYFAGGKKIVEINKITGSLKNSLKVLNAFVTFQGRKQSAFTWSQIILIDARPKHPISVLEIQEILGPAIRQQIEKFGTPTIVLDNWRDINPVSTYFYSVTGFNLTTSRELFTVDHTKIVVDAAQNFARSLNLTHPLIGVHIRVEKIMVYSHDPTSYRPCLRQLKELLKNGSLANTSNSGVVLIHDLTKYGSYSCDVYSRCRAERPKYLSLIKDFENVTVHYDASGFHPPILQRVFAAFVEREFLSTVDILVTIGGGSYQDNIVDRFLNHTSDARDNLHRLECYT